MHNSHLIDQLLSDFTPASDAGLQRGQDIHALSTAEDTGLLEELVPGGEHTNATSGTSGIIAAQEGWRETEAAPFTREDSVMNDVLKQAGEGQGTFDEATCGKKAMSTRDVKMRISALLTLGQTPRQVRAYLEKLADSAVMFDKNIANEFLNDQAGIEGMAVIGPNDFNKSCVASLRHIKANGVLRAASVKRIAACEGCADCKSDHQGGCKCAAYGLPIVSNATELARVVATLIPGTTRNKKAALVARHNGDHGVALPGHTVTHVQAAATATRTTTNITAGQGSVTKYDAQATREAATSTFNAKSVKASVEGGKTFGGIYAAAKKAYGSVTAQRVMRAYLDGLKKTGSRLNIAAVDCSLLRKRLTASETLIGVEKCATCTYRQSMHCGFTGATILSYPGMEATGRKQASADAPDGVQMMDDLGLKAPEFIIDIKGDRDLLPVEMEHIPTLQW